MENKIAISVQDVSVFYGANQVIKDVSFDIGKNEITAFIGPSGCGKSTFLRLFNRMNDYIEDFRMEGQVFIEEQNINHSSVRVEELRRRVGMVCQKPNPFPKSIFENVVFGLRILGIKDKNLLRERAEVALKQAVLWSEVKDDLNKPALALSGGQQQRLCIARALAVRPTIILMDEPTSALDPIATAMIEELAMTLKEEYTLVVVTHNMQQARRISHKTAFFYMGDLIEYGLTDQIFSSPIQERTNNYIAGRFG